MIDLAVSVVLYNTDPEELYNLITKVNKSNLKTKIFLVDNSKTDDLRSLEAYSDNVVYIFNNANLGYGKGHNIAIKSVFNTAKYHLILNADIDFDPSILNIAFEYMEQNVDVGLVSPQIKLPNGEMQYFCRQLPAPFDLFARRFLPAPIKPLFKKRLNSYLLLDKDYSKPMNIPNLPGCFMFSRLDILREVGGFDENFFMYVEDIDLTRRMHQKSKTIYLPDIEVEHGLARGSYKLSKLMLFHINSAIYYFNKWGWLSDKQRKEINQLL
jgi:hypothetical protein